MSSKTNRKQAQQAAQQPVGEPDVTNLIPEVEAPSETTTTTESTTTTTTIATVTAEELILKYGNKSNAIRALAAEGKTRSETAKLLGIRYQHVNNVLGQVLKRVIKKERDEAKETEKLANIEDGAFEKQ